MIRGEDLASSSVSQLDAISETDGQSGGSSDTELPKDVACSVILQGLG